MLAALALHCLPARQAGIAAAATARPLWQRLLGGLGEGSRPLASVAAAGSEPSATAAAAAPGTPWRQHFQVAPGSILRVDLGQAPADFSVKVGEHEGIELTSNSALLAEQGPHPERTGATIGECIGRQPGKLG